MFVQREELISMLEVLKPGSTPKDIQEQSSCVVFKDGYAYTYNEDIFCRTKTKFPKEWEAAVPVTPLLSILNKRREPELEVKLEDGKFHLINKNRNSYVRYENQISLQYDKVTLPSKEDWESLKPHFSDAVTLVQDCAGKNSDLLALTCIHITKDYIEASDSQQIARFHIKTKIKEDLLLKKSSIEPLLFLEPTKIAVTDNWCHFKTANGSLYSIHKYVGDFVDVDKYLKVEGKKIILPTGLVTASEIAEVFSSEDKDNNNVTISLSSKKIKIRGEGDSGGHRETKKVKYSGPDISFMINPKLLREIIDRNNECFVTPTKLTVDGNKYIYTTVLSQVEQKEEESSEDN